MHVYSAGYARRKQGLYAEAVVDYSSSLQVYNAFKKMYSKNKKFKNI